MPSWPVNLALHIEKAQTAGAHSETRKGGGGLLIFVGLCLLTRREHSRWKLQWRVIAIKIGECEEAGGDGVEVQKTL